MVVAYPVQGKKKSHEICDAFIRGCGGAVAKTLPSKLDPHASAFFYGVDGSNQHLWKEAKARGGFYYCDNSYFDSARQEFFRVTYNALQHSGQGVSDCSRFDLLGIAVREWKREGNHIVVCPQSDYFMATVVGYEGNWGTDACEVLGNLTKRPLRYRLWSADKGKLSATLGEDLEGAHALVTYSSAAAVTALLAGISVNCAADCAAFPLSTPIDELDGGGIAWSVEDRLNWAGVLADNQWTLDEMREGRAWEHLAILRSSPEEPACYPRLT